MECRGGAAPVAVAVPRASGSAASSGGGLLSHQMRGEANGNGHARSDGSDRSADARASLDAWDARGAPPAVKTRRAFAIEVGLGTFSPIPLLRECGAPATAETTWLALVWVLC